MSYPDENLFLNDLLKPQESAEGDAPSVCPDPAVIAILAERGTEGELAAAFWRHVIRCESCADLFNRLKDFHHAASLQNTAGEHDQNWHAVRPRLELAIQEIASPDDRPRREPWWKLFSFSGFSQPARFAFAACAALMVVGLSVATYPLFRNSRNRTETAERQPDGPADPSFGQGPKDGSAGPSG